LKTGRVALGYVVAGALAIGLVALPLVPLWQTWFVKIGGFDDYASKTLPTLKDRFDRDGPAAVASDVRAQAGELPDDRFILFASPGKDVLAGTLARWPAAIPDGPLRGARIGTRIDDERMPLVVWQEILPGDYRLLIARKAVLTSEIQNRAVYGIAGTLALLILLGASAAWLLLRRANALRRSEERYERVMLAAQAGFWDWDVLNDEFVVSPRLLEMSELPHGTTFSGRADFMRRAPFHPEDREKWQHAVKQLFASNGSRLAMDIRSMRRDGGVVWQRLEGMCTRDAGGKVVRWTGSAVDIHDRKLAEEALREQSEQLQLGQAAARMIVLDWNLQDDSLRWSDSPEWLRGPLPASGRYPLFKEQIHPQDMTAFLATREHALATLQGATHEFRLVRTDGVAIWVLSRQRVFANPEGKAVRMLAALFDITERKLAEEALRTSQERYALAVAGSDDGVWDLDYAARSIFLSARARELAGMPPGPELVPMDEWLAAMVIHPDDVERRAAAMQAHLVGEAPAYLGEFRLLQRDGAYRWRRLRGLCVRDAEGKPLRMAGSISDIDARKRAEDALRLSEERYAIALEASQEGHFDNDLQTGQIFVSARVNEIYGIPQEASIADRIQFLKRIPFHPDDRQRVIDELSKSDWQALDQDFYEIECRIAPRPGVTRWIHSRAKVVRDAQGRPRRRVGVVADITEQKRATGLLAGEKQLLELMARATPLAAVLDALCRIVEVNCDGCICSILLVDESGIRLAHGAAPSLPREYHQAVHGAPISPDSGPCAMAASLQEQVIAADLATEPRWAEKEWRALALRLGLRSCWSTPIVSSARKPLGTFALYHRHPSTPNSDDQTILERFTHLCAVAIERSRAEKELRDSEARFRTLTELSSDWYWTQDENLRYTAFSGRPHDWAGTETAKVIGKKRWEIAGTEPVSGSWTEHEAVLAAHRPFREFEYRVTAEDGTVSYCSVSGMPMFDEHGRFTGYQGVSKDITARKRAGDALRDQSERLQLGQAAMRMIIMDWNIAEDALTWSDSPDWLLGPVPSSGRYPLFKDLVHPEDRDGFLASRSRAIETLEVQTTEFRLVRTDAEIVWVLERKHAFAGADGKAARMLAAMFDITDRKRAEEALGQMEGQLRRAQRLEALGTLAGGIAHDFNNILGAVIGYGEMALRNARQGSRLQRDVGAILAAGERGRALIDRILAFSRSGIGERMPVHVEAVVREALDQVAANLPDTVTIEPLLRAGRAAMLGDSTQVHQVVMNLATNAVQAMPQGGLLQITLQTAHLEAARPATVGSLAPGDYIVLEVADTGTGIPNDVLERMFDPFFTTKEVGVGSGLGLSLVHGIVTNAGGAIDVVTRPGEGSRFTVYLSRCGDAPESRVDEDLPLPRGAGQCVLVVEDEELLVRLATETLEDLGYAPVSFTSSTAALAAFRSDPARFDAVLTDERMPELSGSALIREVRGIRGAIPVVLMSGYLGMESADADVVLRKPVSARDLAGSMARALRL